MPDGDRRAVLLRRAEPLVLHGALLDDRLDEVPFRGEIGIDRREEAVDLGIDHVSLDVDEATHRDPTHGDVQGIEVQLDLVQLNGLRNEFRAQLDRDIYRFGVRVFQDTAPPVADDVGPAGRPPDLLLRTPPLRIDRVI